MIDEAGLDVIRTDGKGAPVVELHWTAPECDCGRRAWTLWHAPEGGLLVQCQCGMTFRVVAELRK